YYKSNRLNEKSDVYSFGMVLLEIITGKPAMSKTHDNICLGEWVTLMLEEGRINSIVDPRLQGNFSVNTAWKVVEIAINCVSPSSAQRPTMGQVVGDLKECLEISKVANAQENGLRDSYEMSQLDLISADMTQPLASGVINGGREDRNLRMLREVELRSSGDGVPARMDGLFAGDCGGLRPRWRSHGTSMNSTRQDLSNGIVVSKIDARKSEAQRKCSHCGQQGHNSRTCNNRNNVVSPRNRNGNGNGHSFKLFGVNIVEGAEDSMKKSRSMGNLAALSGGQGKNDVVSGGDDHDDHDPEAGYLSDGVLHNVKRKAARERKRVIFGC
ncbi:probable LRR receptor-like serine/threonine-protein kinase At1g53430, partial [Morus notabilis]|uniref:probable LRR receptor-like serine/threonine-protein kinase At1g53430 n=1 Tax=Morus notabilis TaxID=981085 RepID=UPI000CED6960